MCFFPAASRTCPTAGLSQTPASSWMSWTWEAWIFCWLSKKSPAPPKKTCFQEKMDQKRWFWMGIVWHLKKKVLGIQQKNQVFVEIWGGIGIKSKTWAPLLGEKIPGFLCLHFEGPGIHHPGPIRSEKAAKIHLQKWCFGTNKSGSYSFLFPVVTGFFPFFFEWRFTASTFLLPGFSRGFGGKGLLPFRDPTLALPSPSLAVPRFERLVPSWVATQSTWQGPVSCRWGPK